jgi:VWFA-related protein
MRSVPLVICVAAACAVIAFVPPLRLAADPGPLASQKPTFKSGAALVEVDAVIVDKDGQFVPGLRADDLTLLEDGKVQRIQQFYIVTHDLGLTSDAVASEFATQAQYSAHRVFVILFDEAHLANDSLMRVKAGAEQFIREQLSTADAAGVFANGAMFRGRLTNDKAELLAGVRSAKPAFDNRQGLLAPFREFPRIPSEVDAARIADGARDVVDRLAADACTEDAFDCQLNGGLGEVENVIQRKARLYVTQARMLTSRTMQNLQMVTRNLSRIPGRKTLVFVSEGFYVEDSRGALGTIAAEAARGGTTIYSIDGRGLINGLGQNTDVVVRERARSTAFDTADDGPNILTADTGGFMVRGIDDIARAFGLIVRDTSTYYVIGYQPDNGRMDGKVRRIEVKSSRSDVKVRARKGYVAVALPPQQSLWRH